VKPRTRIALLGATGSIGENALEVIRAHPTRLELTAIAGNANVEALSAIAREFGVPHVALCDPAAAERACRDGSFPRGTQVHSGPEGLGEIAALPEVDTALIAIVGTAGLGPSMAAIRASKQIALASKEVLVLAGEYVTAAAREHGASIIPVDSEHNAIFQCLQGEPRGHLERIILTASGGRFRDAGAEELAGVTPEQALGHPNWSMGPKITVDSATMANKGLELIEACWLFGLPPAQVDVVVHPQSIVHSMVRLVDGSILAQLSPPSMTFAIQHALLHPERAKAPRKTLDFAEALKLEFRPPDLERFPCLRLPREAAETGGPAPAIFNAANEIAVQAFLENRIAFLAIPRVIEQTLTAISPASAPELADVLAVDANARQRAAELVDTHAT